MTGESQTKPLRGIPALTQSDTTKHHHTIFIISLTIFNCWAFLSALQKLTTYKSNQ